MPDDAPGYAELHAISNFTFLHGASHPEELVRRASALGYAALALTDECSVAGVVRAHRAAREEGLPLIIGAEFALALSTRVVLLAPDRRAYGGLSALITRARRNAKKGTYRLEPEDLSEGVEGCFALLISGSRAFAACLAERFPGRLWLAATLHHGPDDAGVLEGRRRLGRQLGLPLVAVGGVRMHERGRRPLADTLSAIRLGCRVSEVGYRLPSNAECHLRSRRSLARIYPRALLEESVALASRCRFSLEELRYEYPEELVPPGLSPPEYLRRVTEEGVRRRWPQGEPPEVRTQIEYELSLIAELDYEPYFLTVHDLVRYARGRGILCQGRGSAANSAVCYCLGITEVDPGRMSTLFERFISRERAEPPDIDVDFEHERREEVIGYIYRKYGRERAAIAATVITYRPKSAVRDVGKALGFDLAAVDRLAKGMSGWGRRHALGERLKELGFDPQSRICAHLMRLVDQILTFPRHLSQHTGGFVISRGPLSALVPIENAAMPERTVIQWDKDDLESLALLKVDVLALGMLTALRKSFDLLAGYRGRRLTMAEIPEEDPAVYEMIGQADTVGVFQIESRAQMAMLPRLRPEKFYDLVIEVAIVRPGPIQGGMVHPYLRRRQGLEPEEYPSPAVRKVLQRTLGVPIFQEQVMQLAVVAAGFSPGEADRLRRAMAAWHRRGGLGPFERKLIEGMRARGYEEKFARAIFRQIEGFGEYGFPESHSASFALLAYVSAWLKCHEPAALTCALLNSQPMGFYGPAQLVQDARRHGVEVRGVDVRYSEWDCRLEAGGDAEPALRLGFRMIKGFSESSAARIAGARAAPDSAAAGFASVSDLARRAGLSREDLRRLARAGALAPLAGHRHRAHWEALGVEEASALFPDPSFPEAVPLLRPPSEGEDLVADYRHLALTLGRHPLALLRRRLDALGLSRAAALRAVPGARPARAAGLVVSRQRPSTASGIIFLTLEDESGHLNVVVRRQVSERHRREVQSARLLAVHGALERQGQVVHLMAHRLRDLSALLGRLETRSRDFH